VSLFRPPPLPQQRRPGSLSGVPAAAGDGAFTGSGDIAGAGVGGVAGAGTFAGSVAFAATSAGQGVGVLTGSGALAGGGASLAGGAGALVGVGALAGVSNNSFPVSISANGRYLVHPDGTPFLLCADTTWSLFEDIPLASLNTYFSTLISQGFNAVSSNAMEHHYTLVKPPKERGGLLPFTQKMDGTTFTGSPNGTTGAAGTQGQFASDNYSNINNQAPDCTFINNSYWTTVETILNAALASGLIVLIWPGYLGFHRNDEGWLNEMVVWDAVTGAGGFTGQSFANPAKSKMWNYGAWMAARWKNYPNLIWVMGGDYGSNTQTLSTAESAAVSNLMAGLKSVAGQASLLFTAHWDRPALSTDTVLAAGSFDLNGCYADESVAELARRGFAASPTKPVIGLEYFYELDLFGGSAPFRKYPYWQFLGGVAGGFYGHEQLWRFDTGSPGTDWTTLLATQGRLDAARQFALWKTLPWHRLKPSGLGGMISLITAGGGTASPQSTTYVAAAATSEGDLLLAYIPPDHTGTITVAMTAMAASARARWFDPTNSSFTAIGVIANTGTHVFTTPATNNAGDTDFLLVLDTPAGAFTGSGDMSGHGAALGSGSSGLTGAGAIAGGGAALIAAAGAATGSGTLAGVGAAAVQGAGALSGSGAIAGTGAELATGIGALAGTGALAAVSTSSAAGAASLAGTGTLAAVGSGSAAGSGTLSASGTIAATGASPAPTVGAFTGSGAIAAAGSAGSAGTGTGSLAGSGAIAGAGAQLTAGAGAAAGAGSLAGAGAQIVATVGAMTGSGAFSGASAALNSGAGVGALSGGGAIAGAGTARAAGASAIAATGTISGHAVGITIGPVSGSLTWSPLFGRLQDGGPNMIELSGPLTVYRGDDVDYVLVVTDDTDTPIDLTSVAALEVQVKTAIGAADPPTLSKSIAAGTVVLLDQTAPATKGRASFGFTSAETNITPGLYWLDIVLVLAGKRTHVITPRAFTITDVVNPP
jgi:hypothetical protein